MLDALERPALYYPYIHVRDENWLKATLLCVPLVKRIVPVSYAPEDTPEILKFTRISGPNGPLLQAVPSDSPGSYESQERLLAKLRDHKAEIIQKFSHGNASSRDEYWIHYAKFSDRLVEFLEENRLAWSSEHPNAFGHREWYALHPVLGSALMTTLGLSIANEQHFDIVTPNAEVHDALLATEEDQVFETLMSDKLPKNRRAVWQASRDLGQMVITLSGVNFRALQPEDIPEIQKSKHFRKFQRLLRNRTLAMDNEDKPELYKEKLRLQAEEIVDAWNDTRRDLKTTLRDVFVEQGVLFSGEALRVLAQRSGVTELLIAAGVSVGLFLMKGLTLAQLRERASAFRYLTEIHKAENELLRLTFPIGI